MAIKNHKFIDSDKGSVLLPLLLILVVGIAAMGIYYQRIAAIQRMGGKKILIQANLQAYLLSIRSVIISQSSYIRTLNDASNSTLASCVNDVEYVCSQPSAVLLNLVSENGTGTNYFFNRSKTASDGLTVDLKSCDSYPSLNCPFRFELTWTMLCKDGKPSCYSPDVYFNGQLKIADAPLQILALNPNEYAFTYKVK